MIGFLSGCHSVYSRNYLLSHPDTLRNEVTRCEDKTTAYCTMVKETFSRFNELVNQMGVDPEQFGRQILVEQIKLIELKKQFQTIEIEFDKMNKGAQLSTSSNTILENYQKTKQEYEIQRQKINEMLDIVAATSSPNL